MRVTRKYDRRLYHVRTRSETICRGRWQSFLSSPCRTRCSFLVSGNGFNHGDARREVERGPSVRQRENVTIRLNFNRKSLAPFFFRVLFLCFSWTNIGLKSEKVSFATVYSCVVHWLICSNLSQYLSIETGEPIGLAEVRSSCGHCCCCRCCLLSAGRSELIVSSHMHAGSMWREITTCSTPSGALASYLTQNRPRMI